MLREPGRRFFGPALVAVAGAVAGCAALVAAAAPAVAGTVTPAGGAGSGSIAATQAQADALAGRIQAQGERLAQLAEEADAAQIQASRIDAQLAGTRRQMSVTESRLSATVAQMRRQAVAAYLNQGAPRLAGIQFDATGELGVADAYAAILAGNEEQAAGRLRRLRSDEARQAAELGAEQRQAHDAVAALRSRQQAAAAAQASQQATLAEVKGQLATMVAAAEARQAQSQAQAEKAVLASTGQLPAATHEIVPSASSTTASPDPSPAPAPAPLARPEQPPVYSPPRGPAPTVAPPTDPPTTRPPSTTVAPLTTLPPPSLPPAPAGNVPAPGWQTAVRVAEAQIGKPYQWGGAGPNSYDCSGLVMVAWAAAGVYFPHLAQDQYDMTQRIPLADLLPGDLVFFGTPTNVFHVGMYIGGGDMVDAPETGQDVQIQPIYWSSLLGAGRVRG